MLSKITTARSKAVLELVIRVLRSSLINACCGIVLVRGTGR